MCSIYNQHFATIRTGKYYKPECNAISRKGMKHKPLLIATEKEKKIYDHICLIDSHPVKQ